MTDAEWIESVNQIKDPVKMLECIVENERFFGFDPYYSDLRGAMINSATRIVDGYKVTPDDQIEDRGFMAWFIGYLRQGLI